MNIKIDPDVLKELEYLVELHQDYEAAYPVEDLEHLVEYVLLSIATGSRRPGSWERQLLEMLGLVAECEEHHCYRRQYGKP